MHRSGAKRLRDRFVQRICIEWFPAYAPELNPDEQVWNRTKYADLANHIPKDVLVLGQEVIALFVEPVFSKNCCFPSFRMQS